MVSRLPVFTKEEYNTIDTVTLASSVIGFILISTLLITWSMDKKQRRKLLIMYLSFLSCLVSMSFLVMYGQPSESRFCYDNAIPHSQNESSACTFQSFALFYAGSGCSIVWAVIAVALFLKVVFNYSLRKLGAIFSVFNAALVFLSPLITFLYVQQTGHVGYGGDMSWCFVSADSSMSLDLQTFFWLVMLTWLIGTFCQGCVILEIIKTSRNVDGQRTNEATVASTGFSLVSLLHQLAKSHELMKQLKTPILFISSFSMIALTCFAYRIYYGVHYAAFESALHSWTECVFLNNSEGSMWQDVCGLHPDNRMSFEFSCVCAFLFGGQSIFVFITFMAKPTLPCFRKPKPHNANKVKSPPGTGKETKDMISPVNEGANSHHSVTNKVFTFDDNSNKDDIKMNGEIKQQSLIDSGDVDDDTSTPVFAVVARKSATKLPAAESTGSRFLQKTLSFKSTLSLSKRIAPSANATTTITSKRINVEFKLEEVAEGVELSNSNEDKSQAVEGAEQC